MSEKLCTLCPLSTGSQVTGFGPKDAKLIVIGEFPNNDDESTGIPFSKSKNPNRESATALTRNAVKSIGLDPDRDVYWVHALRCNPFHRKDPIKPDKAKHIDICRTHLERELSEVATPVILALGRIAVISILGNTSGVGANRVFPHHVVLGGHRRTVVVSYSPNEVDRRTLWKLDADLKRVARLSPTGSTLSFFKNDLRLVRDQLQQRGLLTTP